jgi:hypothetical protein
VKAWLGGGAVLLIVVVYLAGYWPQHSQLTESQAKVVALETRISDAEDRIRLGEVLGKLLRLRESLLSKNFGQSAALSSAFFDSVRDEAAQGKRPEVKQLLDTLQRSRDAVTTSIAKADATVVDVISSHEVTLRQALGYPVSADGK